MGTIIGISLLVASIAFIVIGAWKGRKRFPHYTYHEGDYEVPAYVRREDYSDLHEAIAHYLKGEREAR